ncbi:XdhC family aldehyde oxidoreductase maturation factor [Desulfonatronum sp. SC1]|uniref:XdhC family aldehyde oxidoreductase maturation factor n=1 Tax=Desulfonatronum sp. SC1 TaxID=2109626 RepID=UPI0013049C92|nr:XdhC/CoxI family protein [Desulfonatronum sp. SC1]
MNRLENEILLLLEAGQSVALATIVSLSGSAPRTPGTRMVVLPDGAILGTIGGGRLEAEVIRVGLETLGHGQGRLRRFALTGKDAAEMDMICGGVLDVLVEPLRPLPSTIDLLRTLRRFQETGEEPHLVTLLREDADGGGGLHTEHLLARRSASGFDFHPQRPDNAEELTSLLEAARSGCCPTLFPVGGFRAVIEPILGKETLHLFGAGHVSKEVAALAHHVDFRVEVSDDRAEFANAERFPRAEAIHVPENMALDPSRISENSYVVILTRGHKHDMDILAQALRTNAAYIGMIGSRRKRDAIYTALRRQGFADTDLSSVHCPVGLDIDAETPAEIALSIVGELVKIRAANRKTNPSLPRLPKGLSLDK